MSQRGDGQRGDGQRGDGQRGDRSMSRRDLLGIFRRQAEPATARNVDLDHKSDRSFSLDAFYAGRSAAPSLPPFRVKHAATPTPTTRVGLGRTAGAELRGPQPTGEAIDRTEGAQPVAIASTMVPKVLPKRCLATTSFCSVCVERCPIDGAIAVELGRPRVDASRCDGCGRCIAACPAPILAFELVPRVPAP